MTNSPRQVPSQMDVNHLAIIRGNVRRFMQACAERYASEGTLLLDVAPQVHEGARPFFPDSVQVKTFDIDPDSACDYIGDITALNPVIPDNMFDFVVCTEVLEHTLQPFNAVAEIARILRPGGYLFLTVPFNFRIHGPLPDCWRFTEHGLRAILAPAFEIVELIGVDTHGRSLMPVHYSVVAVKRVVP